MRHDEPDVRSYAVTHPRGSIRLPQPSGWDQLVHASSGVMTVQTEEAHWLVTPQRAVWIPDGLNHRIELSGQVQLRTLYMRTGLWKSTSNVRALHVGPLLRELVLHIARCAPLWLNDARSERLVGVLTDQLDQEPAVPLQLPWPVDVRSRAFAEQMVADLHAPLGELAETTGASLRTLQRLFVAETSLTPQRWRIRARLVHATRMLAQGTSVTAAALASGYATPSAFAAAFREEIGTTPSRYVAGD